MKIYIQKYQTTSKFWQWIIGIHLLLLIILGWSPSKKVYHQSMRIQMSAINSSNTGIVAPTVQEEAFSKEEIIEIKEKPAPEEKTSTITSKKKKNQANKKNVEQEKPKKESDKKPKQTEQKKEEKLAMKSKTLKNQREALEMLQGSLKASQKGQIDSELAFLQKGDIKVMDAVDTIKQHIAIFWTLPALPPKGSYVTFQIILNKKGELLKLKKLSSSGYALLDETASIAIEAASPFPMPEDQDILETFMDWELTLRPEELQ